MATDHRSDSDPLKKLTIPGSSPRSSLSRVSFVVATAACILAFWVLQPEKPGVYYGLNVSFTVPPQSVVIDPLSFSVLGSDSGIFRNSSFSPFNPHQSPSPVFHIFDHSFLNIIGPSPSIRVIATKSSAFAHEAPIWIPGSDDVFFSSFPGEVEGENNRVSKISLADVEEGSIDLNVTVSALDLPDTIQMTNGGTGPFRSSLLLATTGRGSRPPSLALVNPNSPHNVTVLLDNFFGRQFNSLNDIKIHPSGKIFFTDVPYGYAVGIRPEPLMPDQVYRFDPETGSVRVVADGFVRCNGIALSTDGRTAYISDTGTLLWPKIEYTNPATIYAFDVDPKTHAFTNRRVFAYTDSGIPDGIQLDRKGNVYSGCGDGVHVWNPAGTLIGKFYIGGVSANMVFAGKGRLVILAEHTIYLARIAAEGINLAYG